ncbi:MAG TPA: FAD-linked oxidase C-terminal domain-containing protein [Phycisphaerae bacterium]|nr:FAD-linked oxidase C-terminal domain-containing protein [Phycisphaerae bacterium]
MSETRYNPITQAIAGELARIVGERYVVFNDPEKLEPYSHDEIADRSYARMPEALVRPATAGEIAEIMKLANRERFAVTPRGAGSGLSGGAVPVAGGVVLLVDRMNRILDIDRENMMAVVQPGVVTNEINEALEPYGLFYAGYPMSLETCYIGGNVAENAGGGKAIKYGVTGRYVRGLEVVTPTGEIVRLGGKLIKDVTGYDLIGLLIGSEGTLGIFTEITLKLLPLPKAAVDLLALFASTQEAIAAVPRIMTASGLTPTSIEFMDQTAMRASCEYLNESIPYRKAGPEGAALLITLDGQDAARLERDYERVGELCSDAGAVEVYVADNATTSRRVWKVRMNIGEAYNVLSRHQSAEDIVVPPARIPQMVAKLNELAEKYDAIIPCYGHAGDGNIHARIVMKPSRDPAEWKTTLPRILKDLYELTSELGGRISGEHGIGHKRKEYMSTVVSQPYLDMLRAIKRAMDPKCVLNPGKIFDS